MIVQCAPGWQKLRGQRPPKCLDSNENFTLYCRNIKICHNIKMSPDLRTFWKTWSKKVLFGVKIVFLGQEVHYVMVYIAYYTEINVQICDYA